jgi:hypothetical protein
MARLCPHCGIKSRFDRVFPSGIGKNCNNDENGFHYIECCQECKGIVYSIWNVDWDAPVYKAVMSHESTYQKEKEDEEATPIEKFSYPFTLMNPPITISDSFEKSFVEGVKCLNVGAPFASVTMFRRCLQIIAEDKGATGRDLKRKLESLSVSGTLTSTLESISTIIREVGNDGAHPNEFEPSIGDAKYILDFLLLLIDQIYILPEKAEELRARRTSSIK